MGSLSHHSGVGHALRRPQHELVNVRSIPSPTRFETVIFGLCFAAWCSFFGMALAQLLFPGRMPECFSAVRFYLALAATPLLVVGCFARVRSAIALVHSGLSLCQDCLYPRREVESARQCPECGLDSGARLMRTEWRRRYSVSLWFIRKCRKRRRRKQ